MRAKINENPVVQVVLVGFLAIVLAFLFLTRVMGGPDAAPAPTTTPAATVTPGADAAGVVATPVDPVTGAAPTPATPVAPAGTGFEPGPGLPGDVVKAYESGDAVVLLISKDNGIEDKRLRSVVSTLNSRSDTTVFMADSRNVARFSRIAQGVDLDRAPALVVIKPRSVNDGGLPVASISYGFRNPESVVQAVRDALYKGKQLPYHPG